MRDYEYVIEEFLHDFRTLPDLKQAALDARSELNTHRRSRPKMFESLQAFYRWGTTDDQLLAAALSAEVREEEVGKRIQRAIRELYFDHTFPTGPDMRLVRTTPFVFCVFHLFCEALSELGRQFVEGRGGFGPFLFMVNAQSKVG